MSRGPNGSTDADESQLVGVAEVAARLSVSAERVRQLAKAGELPDPVGRLGRQLVWQWADVESWARQDGRLGGTTDEGRQAVRPWKRRAPGSLRLVVDDVMSWGPGLRSFCHVRVWAPPTNSSDSHVVLLGQLQDHAGRSVTNDIELVAMTTAWRYLGPAWRQAQFYEYSPANALEDESFLHVSFAIRKLPAGRRRLQPGRFGSELAEVLGGEPVDPSWRRTTREEIEHLTGETPQVWTPGTYTRDLLEATAGHRADSWELTWDPERSRELANLASTLRHSDGGEHNSDLSTSFGIDWRPDKAQLETALTIVAHTALTAKERAQQDVNTQQVDAAISLNAPALADEARLFLNCQQRPVDGIRPLDAWNLLSEIRSSIATSGDPALAAKRQMLVPGLRGGWVTLSWFEANVQEPVSDNYGWGGPIASRSDLLESGSRAESPSPADHLLLLTEALTAYLQEHWIQWPEHDVPAFTPSVVLPARGPLSRSYLDAIDFRAPDEFDAHRLGRLESGLKIAKVGLDPEGWLVAVSRDGREFACEWPVSGRPDPALVDTVIRADRPGAGGPAPVYIERQDGQLHLLPAAGDRRHENAYTWGYPGAGPTNLAAATLDLLRRAAPLAAATQHARAWRVLVDLAGSPRVPDWRVVDLLRQIALEGDTDGDRDGPGDASAKADAHER